jgi:hypothetical protein
MCNTISIFSEIVVKRTPRSGGKPDARLCKKDQRSLTARDAYIAQEHGQQTTNTQSCVSFDKHAAMQEALRSHQGGVAQHGSSRGLTREQGSR